MGALDDDCIQSICVRSFVMKEIYTTEDEVEEDGGAGLKGAVKLSRSSEQARGRHMQPDTQHVNAKASREVPSH